MSNSEFQNYSSKELRNIAIFFGGRSLEHEHNIETCGEIVSAIKHLGYKIKPIKVNYDGSWICPEGFLDEQFLNTKDTIKTTDIENWFTENKVESQDPLIAVSKLATDNIQVAYFSIHGEYAEDGAIQGLLDNFNIKYVGSGVCASSIGMNKSLFYDLLSSKGFKVAPYTSVTRSNFDFLREAIAQFVSSSISFPVIVKPNDRGLSLGLGKATNPLELIEKLEDCFQYSNNVLIQKAIEIKKEVTCGVLEYKNANLMALPVIDLLNENQILDIESKMGSKNLEVKIPAGLNQDYTKKIQTYAKLIHKITGAYSFSRTDFIISTDGQIYPLEINTLPGMSSHSVFPKAAQLIGLDYGSLIKLLLESGFCRESLANPKSLNYEPF